VAGLGGAALELRIDACGISGTPTAFATTTTSCIAAAPRVAVFTRQQLADYAAIMVQALNAAFHVACPTASRRSRR
jgi:hypothetical protein